MITKDDQYYVYIVSNKSRTLLYTGFTGDLAGRIYQHKNKLADGFTSKYNVNILVYYEVCESRESALTREKQIKGFLRQKKIDLISGQNPQWLDLYDGLVA
ncbi:MAG: GIY-YIG nuclease family protein [Dehalococcoidia bacterium]|nr:MAG: GIY-YIG nuclease family protein [Dehalococcoidia bacterium]